MDYSRLLSLCTKVLSSYEEKALGVEQHFQMFLSTHNIWLVSEEEETFVSEVFIGCVRYRTLIKVVVDGFRASHGTYCLKDDFNLYSVLLYLVMFRLEELGISEFRKFVLTQRLRKMHKFLEFFWSKENLYGWIEDEWCRLYDSSFIESNIITPMKKNEKGMAVLIGELGDKLNNKLPSPPAMPVTEPKPFNLTAPKPRTIDVSELTEIPTVKPTKPIPSSTYRRPKLEEKLRHSHIENTRKSEMSLVEADKKKFSCTTSKKSEKTLAAMNKIILEKEEKEKLKMFKALPAPSPKKECAPVTMTTTAIMREGARVMKEEEDIEARLADLEAGGKDKTAFIKWREEMALQDAALERATLERKHLEGQLSYEQAILAKKKTIEDNRQEAKKFRSESEQLMRQYFEKCQEEQQEMRRLVEATTRGHHNTQLMKDKLTAIKRKIVQQVSKENQELMAKALEEEEKLMRQKMELIKQIRAAESFPSLKANFLDLAETPGYGFLSEMSIAELRERLALRTMADEQRMKVKRKEIQQEKKVKQELLASTKEIVTNHKKHQQAHSSKTNDQLKSKLLEQNFKEQNIADLKEKLETKKKEREKLKELVPAPACSLKISSTTSKPPAVKLHSRHKRNKDTCRTATTSDQSLNSTQNAITTLMKSANKT